MSESEERRYSPDDEVNNFLSERNSLKSKAKELAEVDCEIVVMLRQLDEEKLQGLGDWNFHKEGHPVGGVANLNTQMTPRDFVIAKTALGIVKEKVQESLALQETA